MLQRRAVAAIVLLATAAIGTPGLAAGCGSSKESSGFTPGGGGNDASMGTDGSAGDDAGSSGRDGPGFGTTDSPSGNGDAGDACSPNLTGRLRDFVNKPGFTPSSALDTDFENVIGDDRGIVETDLGPTGKPVYAHSGGTTLTTHGQMLFDYWYRDTSGINIPYDYTIMLTPLDGGVSTFDDQEFFPLDGRGWNDEYVGDDGNMHNFSFTFELHTTFEYTGGEVFTFIGDDDVFVFIAKKLVVDLGGVHGAETKAISLDTLVTDDASAAPVPLAKGTTYPLDIFYNERHTVSSHFRMDTSIVFNNCTPIIIPQ